jgi:predicted ester cyclase
VIGIDTVKSLRDTFADLHYEEQEIIASKDKVIILVTVSGKHIGNFFSIPPTGRSFSLKQCICSELLIVK